MAGQYHCLVYQDGVQQSHSVRDTLDSVMLQASYAHLIYARVGHEMVTTDVGPCSPTTCRYRMAPPPTDSGA